MKRFKVGFVLPHFRTGGVETVTLRLLEELDRAVFDPRLVLQKREGALLDRLPKDVELIDLAGHRASGAILEFRRLIRAEKLDLIYTANNAVNLMVLAATRAMPGRPKVVVSDHTPLSDFLADAKLKSARRVLISALYPKADALCAPIDEVLSEYREMFGTDTPPCWQLPNPVLPPLGQTHERDPQVAARLEDLPRPLVLSAGRLSFEKGVDRLIEAFFLFCQEEPGASLAILGDGPERAALEAVALEMGIGGNVHFFGNVVNAQAYFGLADVFALTSRREGFGNVLIEALAAHLPVVAYDCPHGPRRILDGGRLGHLVEDGQTAKFASKLSEAVRAGAANASFSEELEKMSIDYATDQATRAWEKMALSILEAPEPIAVSSDSTPSQNSSLR